MNKKIMMILASLFLASFILVGCPSDPGDGTEGGGTNKTKPDGGDTATPTDPTIDTEQDLPSDPGDGSGDEGSKDEGAEDKKDEGAGN
jgi:hypothetical protein